MLRIISLLSGPTDVAPTASDRVADAVDGGQLQSWHANRLARAGPDRAGGRRAQRDRREGCGRRRGPRDTYWLATLSMLADAAHLAGHAATGVALWECLRPLAELTVLYGALIYRGAAAHFAGLAAAGRGSRARGE